MSGSMVRAYDKGIFSPGGLFEAIGDERINSLLPRWAVKEEYTNTTEYTNTADPTKKILTEEEINELIGNASTRPLAPESRLDELTKAANLSSNTMSMSSRFFNLSISDIVKKTAGTYVGIINDLVSMRLNRILTKDDRLIYIGISMIIYAILLMLIRLVDFKK